MKHISPFNKSVNAIKKNKGLCAWIFIGQALCFILIGYLFMQTIVPAADKYNEIIESVSTASIDDYNLIDKMLNEQNLLGYNSEKVKLNYSIIEKFAIQFLSGFLLIFLIGFSTLWYLASKLFESKSTYFDYVIKFNVVSIVFIFIGIFLIGIIGTIVGQNPSILSIIAVIGVIVLLSYFYFIILGILHSYSLSKLFYTFIDVLKKKWYLVLIQYFLNVSLLFAAFWLLMMFVAINVFFGALLSILFIAVYCMRRILLIAVLDKRV